MKKDYKEKIKGMTPTTKGFILIIIILVLGILFRWNFIINEIVKGFKFFSN
ncbi:hypothetical protein SDC9_51793 [bioreactor metagenome]|jgi:hypothetical protein|uniref:Uncharacterized protein n=1 Tax=bioreactor metagenome TaxID=1076179 RepID=A0A644WTL1_9ZZZZ